MKGQKFSPWLVIAAGLLAYHNSFTGPFIFDDLGSIPNNPTIRHLWPIWQCLSPPQGDWLTVEGRPLINLSLAINYALGGYRVWGYHALNLAVHILVGLTLLGSVRRTLLQPVLRERFGASANELALAIALLWTVHPLQTESVTYVIQRAESIMGLFYLLTMYCFIRGVESQRSRLWYGLCIGACALGMASKEVMVSAPLMVMLYDRAFVSGTFRKAWRQRWRLYLALASTWIVLGFLLVSAGIFAYASISAQRSGYTWWEYLATQPGVILHYLRLSVWPSPLCLDRGWPIARTWMGILPATVVVVILLAASAWAWRTNPVWGFVGAWFFLILAPSSSVVPIPGVAFEHRLYLSLAAVVGLGVIGIHVLAPPRAGWVRQRGVAVIAVLVVGLAFLTWRRNQDYRSELTIWQDTVVKSPNNPRAHNNLGNALLRVNRTAEAVGEFEQALRLKPDDAEAYYNWGMAVARLGRVQEAMEHWKQALSLKPDDAEALNNLGIALYQLGEVAEAIKHYERALRIKPDYIAARHNLGVALSQMGRIEEAIGQFEQVLRLRPDYAEAHYCLGDILLRLGRVQAAIEHYEQAVRIDPEYVDAHNNLGAALLQLGRVQEAIGHFEEVLRLKPDLAAAHYNLGVALEHAGKIEEAIRHYEQVLRIRPGMTEAQDRLARLRAVQ